MIIKIINFIGFQIGWFTCAFSAAYDRQWIAIGVVVCMLFMHLSFSKRRKQDFYFIFCVTVLGGLIETMAGLLGIYWFNGSFYANWIVPLWFLALWALFASTLHYSLSWLNRRYLLAAFLGAIAGPLSYFGGEKIGALDIIDNTAMSLSCLIIIWGAGMPFFMWLSCQKPFSKEINIERTTEGF